MFGKLEPGYPFASMLSVEDIPDIEPVKIKDIVLVKTALASPVYLLCNKILHPIIDEETFKEYFGDWKLVEVIDQTELDKYEIGDKIISAKSTSQAIMKLFNNK